MNARSQHHDVDTGLEEYEFLYIAPPTPSSNWKAPSRIRWTNIALLVAVVTGSIGILGGCFYAGRLVLSALR